MELSQICYLANYEYEYEYDLWLIILQQQITYTKVWKTKNTIICFLCEKPMVITKGEKKKYIESLATSNLKARIH